MCTVGTIQVSPFWKEMTGNIRFSGIRSFSVKHPFCGSNTQYLYENKCIFSTIMALGIIVIEESPSRTIHISQQSRVKKNLG